MIGKVDDRNRALIDLEVRQTPNSQGTSVTAWIDTAFDGHLVFPLPLIQELELQSLVDRIMVRSELLRCLQKRLALRSVWQSACGFLPS